MCCVFVLWSKKINYIIILWYFFLHLSVTFFFFLSFMLYYIIFFFSRVSVPRRAPCIYICLTHHTEIYVYLCIIISKCIYWGNKKLKKGKNYFAAFAFCATISTDMKIKSTNESECCSSPHSFFCVAVLSCFLSLTNTRANFVFSFFCTRDNDEGEREMHTCTILNHNFYFHSLCFYISFLTYSYAVCLCLVVWLLYMRAHWNAFF